MLDKPKNGAVTSLAARPPGEPVAGWRPPDIEGTIDIPAHIISEQVDVGAARKRLLEDLIKIKVNLTPALSLEDNVVRCRERVAAQMHALLTFAKKMCPSAEQEIDRLTRESAQGISAVLDQNDRPGGHPLLEPEVKIERGRPKDHREKQIMQSAAAASVTILLEQKTMREPQARKYVARKIGKIGKLVVSASTVKKWRTSIAENNNNDPRPQILNRYMTDWRRASAIQKPTDFVDALLAHAARLLHATLPSDN